MPARGRPATYVEYLAVVGLRPNTVRNYAREIRFLHEWCHQNGTTIKALALGDYEAYADTRPNTPGVRSHLRNALIRWWEWQELPVWPKLIAVPTQPEMVCKALEPVDVERLVKVAKGWYPEGVAVLVGIGLGVRNAEMRGLRWESFTADLSWVTVLGKGNKIRHEVVPDGLRVHLEPHRGSGYLFKGRHGGAVSHATICNYVKRVAEAAGITERVWPHRLRHTFGAEANDRTGDIRAVAKSMGHSRLETTKGYTRTTEAALRKVAGAIDELL